MQIEALLSRLERVRKTTAGWTARCPAHADTNPSLSVSLGDDARILLKCFAQCELPAIVAALDLEVSDLFAGPPPTLSAPSEPEVVYDYCDENGQLIFQVVRGPGKRFRQRRPDGANEWLWNLSGVRRLLYRLPEVLAADPRAPVFVVEGEKDVENLWRLGLVATTNPQGAGKWRAEFSEALRGRDVVILPDNDDPGRKHAAEVGRYLQGIARTIRLVELPEPRLRALQRSVRDPRLSRAAGDLGGLHLATREQVAQELGRLAQRAPLFGSVGRLRHARGDRVLCGEAGESWTRHMIRAMLRTICKRAGLRIVGAHVLRHTFCSHLAMWGAAPKAIQELAGHKSLKVTLRYMHLTETALRDTIRLLDVRDEKRSDVPPTLKLTAL